MTRVATPIYMDNHATTPVDARVVDAMLPYFTGQFGNAASTTHAYGWQAKEAVDRARQTIAAAIGAQPDEIVFTSGATESNNLAIRGVADQARRRGNHVISVATEHPSVLDPLKKLAARGCEVTLLPVCQSPNPHAGHIAPEQVAEAIRDDTILVSVMLANNEIGLIQPLPEIGQICADKGVLLHTDAAQALGKIPVNVDQLGVDLLSFSGHKIYGPKGIGGLYVRRHRRRVRLEPQMLGGRHEGGLRSGTLNTPGIVGMARALELCLDEIDAEAPRLAALRNRLFDGLRETIGDVALNGPALLPELRLPGNLNVSIGQVDGETLLLSAQEVALSTGSACSSARSEPSHVLEALGLDPLRVQSSLRFGLGRFNTAEEVEAVLHILAKAVSRLRKMTSPLNPPPSRR